MQRIGSLLIPPIQLLEPGLRRIDEKRRGDKHLCQDHRRRRKWNRQTEGSKVATNQTKAPKSKQQSHAGNNGRKDRRQSHQRLQQVMARKLHTRQHICYRQAKKHRQERADTGRVDTQLQSLERLRLLHRSPQQPRRLMEQQRHQRHAQKEKKTSCQDTNKNPGRPAGQQQAFAHSNTPYGLKAIK